MKIFSLKFILSFSPPKHLENIKKGCNFAAEKLQSYVLLRFLGRRKAEKLRIVAFGQRKRSKNAVVGGLR